MALRDPSQIAVGSLIDTRRGTVRLTTATNTSGDTQSGEFSAGSSRSSSRGAPAPGLTELPLKGGNFRRCATGSRRSTAAGLLARTAAKRKIRKLRGNATGRFRTRGRNSSATVRGTIWDTIDRCDGTLTSVRQGSVLVRDFIRRRNIVVRAGRATQPGHGARQTRLVPADALGGHAAGATSAGSAD